MRDKAKPIKAKPSFYAICFEGIKSIGMRYGYNIVLHGSLDRDLDLIAVPLRNNQKKNNRKSGVIE